MRKMTRHGEAGTALLIVLLLVATLAVIAVGMTRTLRLSTARTLAGETVTQARWYAVSTETLGIQIMQQQWQQEPARDTIEDQWVREPALFPIDNGAIEARLTDQTACFNINSLVSQEADGLAVNDERLAEYRRLLDSLGFDEFAQDALADSVIDWLDTDSSNRPNGAEDADYARLAQPYRAGNTLMADLSELRAVYWYTPEVYNFLKPYLCAHPSTDMAAININLMVRERDIPVLYAALDGLLTVDQTRELVNAVPDGGYQSVEQFWQGAGLQQDQIPQELFQRPKLWSEFVRLDADVKYDRATIGIQSLLKIDNTGQARVVARKFGSDG